MRCKGQEPKGDTTGMVKLRADWLTLLYGDVDIDLIADMIGCGVIPPEVELDLDSRELRVGLRQEGWARLGRISITHDGSTALSVLEIDLDDGGLRRFQSDTGRGIADLVLDLIKRGVTCLAREYGYYTPKDELAEQIDSLNTRLQAAKQAKQRAMIKARVTNTLGKRP